MRQWILGLMLVGFAGEAGCGSRDEVQAPDLQGHWVFDGDRADQLYVVSSVPEGPERQRALERAHRDLGALEVELDATTATMRTQWSDKTVQYQVASWYGPLVVLVARKDDHAPPVSSSLKLQDDRLTWFDADGEIEFVLRRAR